MNNIMKLIEEAKKNHPGPFFMGIPDEWYEEPHFWCKNGHLSRRYLKSEAKGADL
jgi:hypothetical protein